MGISGVKDAASFWTMLMVVFLCLMVSCRTSAFTIQNDDDDDLETGNDQRQQQQQQQPKYISRPLSFSERHMKLLQNANMDDIIKNPIEHGQTTYKRVTIINPDDFDNTQIKELFDRIVKCNYEPNCINSRKHLRNYDGDDDDDSNEDCENGKDCDGSKPNSQPNQEFDPWTLVWYIGSFGGLIVFFLMVSCSEWCCKKYQETCPEQLAATTISGATAPPGANVAPERNSPPPGYHLFAPPDYDHAKEKEKFDVYVVPTHTVNQVLVNQRSRNPDSSSAAPFPTTGNEASAPPETPQPPPETEDHQDLPPSYSSLSIVQLDVDNLTNCASTKTSKC